MQDVIAYIDAARTTGRKQGLENTLRLMEKLHIMPSVPVVHIAGTNGKGSTCAMLAFILESAGLRTGLYTSPFLQTYAERFRIGGRLATEEEIQEAGVRLMAAAEALRGEGVFPTPFELGTALACLLFEDTACQVWILETGMGGTFDATTAVPATLCGITPIGMDHRQYLGTSLQEIAGHKAGIMRRNVPCIAASMAEAAAQVLARHAQETGAPLRMPPGSLSEVRTGRTGTDAVISAREQYALHIPLAGSHQAENALLAVSLAEELRAQGVCIPKSAIEAGIARVRWPGRLEWCGNVLIDGAHNPPALEALGRYLQTLSQPPVLVAAVMADKDLEAVSDALGRLSDRIVCVPLHSPRALSPDVLADMLQRRGVTAFCAQDLPSGLQLAREKAGEGDIVCTGSLYLAGEVRTALGLEPV